VPAVRVASDLAAAPLSALDDWQYRSGWPAGTRYARAAELVANQTTTSGRIYMVDGRHLVGAGAFQPSPGKAWIVQTDAAIPSDARGDLIVMVDDVDLSSAGALIDAGGAANLRRLGEQVPGATLLGYFAGADSQSSVAVLRVAR
jgi:hypothetical protein